MGSAGLLMCRIVTRIAGLVSCPACSFEVGQHTAMGDGCLPPLCPSKVSPGGSIRYKFTWLGPGKQTASSARQSFTADLEP